MPEPSVVVLGVSGARLSRYPNRLDMKVVDADLETAGDRRGRGFETRNDGLAIRANPRSAEHAPVRPPSTMPLERS